MRTYRARSTDPRPCRSSAGPSTTSRQPPARRERQPVPDEPARPRTRAEDPNRPAVPARPSSSGQAAHEKPDFDNPVFPSYRIPKASMLELLASAMVKSDPTGWNIPENRTGSPVSTPNGTMSSITKSIEVP